MSAPLYVYAVVSSGRTTPPDVAGVGPGPLTTVEAGGVAAVAGAVDLTQFEPPAIERNVADAAWLERVARAHEAVVEALLGDEAVLPMRFGSIFSGVDAVRGMLKRNAIALEGLLEEVRGRVELGVTVRIDRDRLVRASTAAAGDRPASGRDYLRRRQEVLRSTEEAGATTAALVDDVHRTLAAAADRAAVLEPRRSDPSLALSAAYLVPVAAVGSFTSRVDAVRRVHADVCSIEITGPWPPYSFTSVDVTGPRS